MRKWYDAERGREEERHETVATRTRTVDANATRVGEGLAKRLGSWCGHYCCLVTAARPVHTNAAGRPGGLVVTLEWYEYDT